MLNNLKKNHYIKDEFFYLEKKAIEFYKNKKYKHSFKYYKKLLKACEDFKNNSNEYHFKWYDEILYECLEKYSDDFDEFFKHLYQMDLETYDAWFDKAQLYDNNHRRSEAIDYCYELLKIKHDDLSVLEFTGHALCFSERYDESLEIYDIALSIDKNNKNIINGKLYVYYTSDRIDEALDLCKNLKNANDIPSFKYLSLGFKFEEKGDFETALWCYEKGFEVENEDIDEYYTDAVDSVKRILLKMDNDDYSLLKDFYLEWISKIEYKFDTVHCSKCGDKLTPIVYGYIAEDKAFEESEKGNIIIGGCVVDDSSPTHYCKHCDEEFQYGCNGLKINYPFNSKQYSYVKKMIDKLTYYIDDARNDEGIEIKELQKLIEFYGLNELEFNTLINKLIDIGYLKKSNLHITLSEDNYYSFI